MKLYRTIRREIKTIETHDSKGKRYKKPRTKTHFENQVIEVEDSFSFIYNRLTSGHLENNIDQISKYLAALTIGDKEKMARLLEVNYREKFMDKDFEFHEITGYEFRD